MTYAACFPSPSADFSWLSRLGLRPRERLFWWRLAQDAIPTRCWLLRRGLTDSGVCPWGCPSPENRDHIMRGCSNIAVISRELHRWGIDMPGVQDWESFPALVSSTRKLNSGPLRVFCYVVYQHWRARNAKVHGPQEILLYNSVSGEWVSRSQAGQIGQSESLGELGRGRTRQSPTRPGWGEISSSPDISTQLHGGCFPAQSFLLLQLHFRLQRILIRIRILFTCINTIRFPINE
ncbi:hypothetical protein KSP39_PZI021774 [Platanthera zijinensis]|uniref:Reverse transcriptase zinc-binding domain-containing protein n=1 Tax=Platanthera zijinensis TaxID=2320716 RepID=A0AAP0AX88_9ASPA